MKKLTTLLAFAFCLNVNAQVVCFDPVTNYNVGSQPTSVTSADFNNDGNVDLAVANSLGNNVSVLLGTGMGNFYTATSFTVENYPWSVCSADFNNDSHFDLATVSSNGNTVSVILGNGTGSFGAATSFTVGSDTKSVCSADFNNDGKADLATANSGSNNVSILLGTGTGSFGTATNFLVGTYPYSVITADFNNDGKKDLAVANESSSSITVMLGNGAGIFGVATSTVTYGTQALCSGDFNGDGKTDLSGGYYTSGSTSIPVLLGLGTGYFGTVTNYTIAGASEATSITTADFNGDGKADLAASDYSMGGIDVFVLLGSGTGSFSSQTNLPNASVYPPISIITADFNNDGKPDLATANTQSNIVAVFLNCSTTAIPTHNQNSLNIYSYNNAIITNGTIPQGTQLKVVNALGQVVLNTALQNNIETNLPSGIYTVQVIDNTGSLIEIKKCALINNN